jgi:hypothetical protein
MANFQPHALAKSHRSHVKGCSQPLVELQNFVNDLVTDSPPLGRAGSVPNPSTSSVGSRSSKKRPLEDLEVEGYEGYVKGMAVVEVVAIGVVDQGGCVSTSIPLPSAYVQGSYLSSHYLVLCYQRYSIPY